MDSPNECSLLLDSFPPYYYPGFIVSGKVYAVFGTRALHYKKLSVGVHGFLTQPVRVAWNVIDIIYEKIETGICERTEVVVWSYVSHSHSPLQQGKTYEFPFQIRLPPAMPLSISLESNPTVTHYQYTMKYYVQFKGLTNALARVVFCETPLHVVQHIDLSTPLLRQPVETRQVIRRSSFLCIPAGGTVSISINMPYTGLYAGTYMPLSLEVHNDTRWKGSVCAKLITIEQWNFSTIQRLQRLIHTKYKSKERLASNSTVRWGSDRILIPNTVEILHHDDQTLNRTLIFQVQVKVLGAYIAPIAIPITIGLAGHVENTTGDNVTSQGPGVPTSGTTASPSQAALTQQEITSAGAPESITTSTIVSDMSTELLPSYEQALQLRRL